MEIYVDNDRRVFVSFGNGPFLVVTEDGVEGEWFIPQGVEVYDSATGSTSDAWDDGYDEGYEQAAADAADALSSLDSGAGRRKRDRRIKAVAEALQASLSGSGAVVEVAA